MDVPTDEEFMDAEEALWIWQQCTELRIAANRKGKSVLWIERRLQARIKELGRPLRPRIQAHIEEMGRMARAKRK